MYKVFGGCSVKRQGNNALNLQNGKSNTQTTQNPFSATLLATTNHPLVPLKPNWPPQKSSTPPPPPFLPISLNKKCLISYCHRCFRVFFYSSFSITRGYVATMTKSLVLEETNHLKFKTILKIFEERWWLCFKNRYLIMYHYQLSILRQLIPTGVTTFLAKVCKSFIAWA